MRGRPTSDASVRRASAASGGGLIASLALVSVVTLALGAAVLLPSRDARTAESAVPAPRERASANDARASAVGAALTLDGVAVPDDAALLDDLARGVDLRRREDFDRVLDARDPG